MSVASAPAGLGVEESGRRLAAVESVLRELVHLAAGRLALEPRLEIKGLLGAHLHDDAQAVHALRRRLQELGAAPHVPGAALQAKLDRAHAAPTPEALALAYGTLKPALVEAVGAHLAALDPLAEEPTLRLLTWLRHRQERHVAELPAERRPAPPLDDPGTGERRLPALPPVDRPARDAYVTVAPDAGGAHPLHDAMDAALCEAELASRASHEHPERPLDFHLDMARLAWDGVRHAAVLDHLMATEHGCRWGEHPVTLRRFTDPRSPPPPLPPGDHPALAHLRADRRRHAEITARWNTTT